MPCLEACDSDVIQMCTRYEATENKGLLYQTYLGAATKRPEGHRANSPVLPRAMMQVDMAVPDEERQDVLNTTSFELLEMTQEQTEVGMLKGLVR